MAQKWIAVYNWALVLLLTCMCIESAVAQQSNVIPKSSYYELVNVSDIDNGVIAATYTNVRSKVSCGVKCSGIAAKSFYFVSNSSKCHCNTLWIDHAALTVAQSNITYGKLKQENVTESPSTGNLSNCQELYISGIRNIGTYSVLIGNETSDVFCDLSDGGWIVFQRRFDGSVDFKRNWTDYVNGFGDKEGEFWLGLETVHQMTKTGCELLILLEANQNSSRQTAGFAKYTTFSVGDSSSNYTLNIGNFSGNVGDSMEYHNGLMFSTFDLDNDESSSSCSLNYGSAGWWYKYCWLANLNGQYFAVLDSSCQGIGWNMPWVCEALARVEMKFRC